MAAPITSSAIVTLHQRGKHGWAPTQTLPANASEWSAVDQQWIEELLCQGETVLTVGDCMYEVKWK